MEKCVVFRNRLSFDKRTVPSVPRWRERFFRRSYSISLFLRWFCVADPVSKPRSTYVAVLRFSSFLG